MSHARPSTRSSRGPHRGFGMDDAPKAVSFVDGDASGRRPSTTDVMSPCGEMAAVTQVSGGAVEDISAGDVADTGSREDLERKVARQMLTIELLQNEVLKLRRSVDAPTPEEPSPVSRRKTPNRRRPGESTGFGSAGRSTASPRDDEASTRRLHAALSTTPLSSPGSAPSPGFRERDGRVGRTTSSRSTTTATGKSLAVRSPVSPSQTALSAPLALMSPRAQYPTYERWRAHVQRNSEARAAARAADWATRAYRLEEIRQMEPPRTIPWHLEDGAVASATQMLAEKADLIEATPSGDEALGRSVAGWASFAARRARYLSMTMPQLAIDE